MRKKIIAPKEVNTTFFWNVPQDTLPIKIVNPQDFTVPDIIKKIRSKGLLPESFGLTDFREIQLRNEVSAYLIKNPELIKKISIWRGKAKQMQALPTGEDEFLAVYGKDTNPYWEMIKEIIAELDVPGAPRRLKALATNLKSSLGMEEAESKMAARISEKLEKVTVIEGVVELSPFGSSENLEKFILGKKEYSATWSGIEISYPKWTKNFLARITGIGKITRRVMNSMAEYEANRSAAIMEFPISIYDDISDGLDDLLSIPVETEETKIETPTKATARKKSKTRVIDPRVLFYRDLREHADLFFTLSFLYDGYGLKLNVIGINHRGARKSKFDFKYLDFEGFTPKEKAKAKATRDAIRQKIDTTRGMLGLLEIYNKLEQYSGLFTKGFIVPSLRTDAELKWYALGNLYQHEDNVMTYNVLMTQRRSFRKFMDQLNNLGEAINLFRSEATRLNIPLCAPEIRDNSHIGVSFNGMAPINMMEQGKTMIPFTMPIINGRMICLTGRHGGGKSVAGKSVIENIYLAQSGLPVFAESFSTDVKTVLGAVTNDQGEGSTATVFVEKVKNLFSEIAKVPKEQSLIFIDEIGKGTQETQGFDLGLNILTALKGQQYSVIFNTQIMRLAETAKDELGAICLKVDKDHSFTEGIGDCQMEQLVKESGLDKFFINN